MNIWITGASTGIGLALARHYALAGHRVVLSARSVDNLAAAVASLPAGTSHAVPLDVTDEAAVMAAVEDIEARYGPLDLAVLNAGTYAPVRAASFTSAAARQMMEVNYFGICHGLAALMPRFMARGRGQIAAMASVAGYCGLPYAGTYSASKSAVIRLCESLAPELAAAGVQLNVVNPGFVATPLTAKNDFPMPFLMEPEAAAKRIAEGLASGHFEVRFPRRLAWLLGLIAALPYPLYFALTKRMLRPA
jgi:NAD(P)-dependent dehydrogenase (short-subunit alcohol dehydrogenase family)